MTPIDRAPLSRNAPCPCGSGRRYKNCCAPEAQAASAAQPAAYPGWDRIDAAERTRLLALMQRALAAQTAGELDAARELYEQVVACAPQTFDALHMLGVVLYQQGRLADALVNIRRALELTDWRNAAMRSNLCVVADAAVKADAQRPPSALRPIGGLATRSDKPPKVSVIVSTYNASACLPGCLEDLARQSIADALEIIVVDSGSSEDERAIAGSFESRFPNLVYVRTRRETLHAAWNRGLALARGTYITNANTDDAHRADALERMTAALDACPEADFAYSDYHWSARANDPFADPHVTRTVRHPPFHPAHAMFYCVLGCHPMWRRTLFEELGGFDAELTAVGDYEMLLRAIAAGRRPIHVPEPLSLFYQNPEGLTFQSKRAQHEVVALQNRYRASMPIARLYAIDAHVPSEVAAAWTALGALATRVPVPWFDAPHHDDEYAAHCFRQALNANGGYAPAIANLGALLALRDQADAANAVLDRLPRDEAERVSRNMAQRAHVFAAPEVAPAFPPLDYARESASAAA